MIGELSRPASPRITDQVVLSLHGRRGRLIALLGIIAFFSLVIWLLGEKRQYLANDDPVPDSQTAVMLRQTSTTSSVPQLSRGTTILNRDQALVEQGRMKNRKTVPIQYSTVLVIMTHDRIDHLKRTLESVLKARNVEKFQIIISMDSPRKFSEIREAVKSVAGNRSVGFYEQAIPFSSTFSGVAGATRHVGSILRRVFESEIFEYLILLEDDLLVAPDFFDYFSQVGPLLYPNNPASGGLFCASAWNDHAFGGGNLVFDESEVMRTNWYPGLGVMFHKSVWLDSWKLEWPFWDAPDWNHDQWIRYESSSRDKDCIAPQVPRTHHVSSEGLHVDSSAQRRYDGMILSKGEVRIREDSLRIASDPIATRDRYLDMMKGANRITVKDFMKVDLSKNGQSSFVVHLNDVKADGSITDDPQFSRELFAKLGIFPFYLRMFFRGLLVVHTRGDTSVFIQLESMKEYWS